MKANNKTKSRFTIPFSLIHLLSLLLMKSFFQLEVRGCEHFRELKKPLIFAGNHTGYLDSLIVAAAIRRPFTFLMSEEVFDWESVGNWVRYGNILPLNVKKPLSCFRTTLERLKQGQSICIFPEGKLTIDGHLGVFNSGVAFLQEKSQLPVIPFAIKGGYEAWAFETPRPRFRKIVIEFGEPILPQASTTRDEMTALIKSRVQSLLDAGEAQWPSLINANVV
jgi:1-acyl-sn-glycerol-3-phosphate acyltransferase